MQAGSTETSVIQPTLACNNHDQKLPISYGRLSIGGRASPVRSDDLFNLKEIICCRFAVYPQRPIAAPTIGWEWRAARGAGAVGTEEGEGLACAIAGRRRRRPPGLPTEAWRQQGNQ